jgi:hypothetical protein
MGILHSEVFVTRCCRCGHPYEAKAVDDKLRASLEMVYAGFKMDWLRGRRKSGDLNGIMTEDFRDCEGCGKNTACLLQLLVSGVLLVWDDEVLS